MSPEHLLMMTLYGFELGLRNAWNVSLFTTIILLLLLLLCRVLILGQSLTIFCRMCKLQNLKSDIKAYKVNEI